MLNKILERKKEEAAQLILPPAADVHRYSFSAALEKPHRTMGLIAEVKKASPSKGLIKENFHPVNIAASYAAGKADCLSVLTDRDFFQGSPDYIEAIKQETELPILRKDFIISHIQVEESFRIGADALLLIAEALDPLLLQELYVHAQELGMDVLVEVHSPQALESVLTKITPSLLGVNNRNLSTFQTNVHQLKEMRGMVPKQSLLISESGISSYEDVELVKSYGAKAILAGESLMRQENQTDAILQLFGENL
ncbi:indole-3-glycerol phosphate synthase TrpC [Bacillus lacus]|uniref:Indole-3-glycerol phosphate synthase n=1 Tax=Metabacillus lacus TaxID=1983721 RepID=A0A7X2IWJ5_9BACI|nr:indole-3-glycerol phosphate synthase TrpC [Metabacillus lacus]MRX70994.1 indole-3-glycerol phosphate synthase TrpC [Metabacillus lacus]